MDIRIDGDASFRDSYLDVEWLHPKKKDKKENIYSTILVNKEKFSLNHCIENN